MSVAQEGGGRRESSHVSLAHYLLAVVGSRVGIEAHICSNEQPIKESRVFLLLFLQIQASKTFKFAKLVVCTMLICVRIVWRTSVEE